MQEYVLEVVIELELSTQEKRKKKKEKRKRKRKRQGNGGMDVVLGKAYFSWRGRTRFRSAFSFCLGLCVARRKKIKKERKLRSLFATMSKRKKKETGREREKNVQKQRSPCF